MPIPGEHEDITRHIEPMDISVKGKNLDVGNALSSYVGAQLDGAQHLLAKQLRPYKRKLVNHHAKNPTVDNALPARQYWLDRSGQHLTVAENDRVT
jgi:ribosome-associated translation inhibitor RaiA